MALVAVLATVLAAVLLVGLVGLAGLETLGVFDDDRGDEFRGCRLDSGPCLPVALVSDVLEKSPLSETDDMRDTACSRARLGILKLGTSGRLSLMAMKRILTISLTSWNLLSSPREDCRERLWYSMLSSDVTRRSMDGRSRGRGRDMGEELVRGGPGNEARLSLFSEAAAYPATGPSEVEVDSGLKVMDRGRGVEEVPPCFETLEPPSFDETLLEPWE